MAELNHNCFESHRFSFIGALQALQIFIAIRTTASQASEHIVVDLDSLSYNVDM